MANLEEQFNEQILKGTVPVNDQNLQQALIETAVLDDLNDVNISSPTDGQALGYQASTNSWQNITVNIPNGDKGDITTSGGGSTWTIDNNAVVEAKIADSAVTENKVANNAITVNKIANDSVTNSKLANMATATVKGRATASTGDPEDLAIDNDLSTVSASDDTIPSAKAVKAYVDILELKTRLRNGGLLNGFIRVTVVSNDLIVAISTSPTSQVDPTATNPVYVWIGDTLRSITGAMNSTMPAGNTYFNAGGAELATREIDYFAYIGKATSGGALSLGFSRVPGARLGSDFNDLTLTEKYGRFDSANILTANITEVVNIGRFAATLSGSPHNWSVPAFTNVNLIQEPIYETRRLSYQPTYSGEGSMTWTSITTNLADYKIVNRSVIVYLAAGGTTGGSASSVLAVSFPIGPYTTGNTIRNGCSIRDGGNSLGGFYFIGASNIRFNKVDGSNYGLGADREIWGTVSYDL